MAFPQLRTSGYTTGAETSNTTSHSVTLPSGVSTGDLILVLFAVDDSNFPSINTGISGSNWNTVAGYTDGYHTAAVYWKTAEASNALSLDTSGSDMASYIAYAIYGHRAADPLDISTYASSSSTNINPPALSPSYSSSDYLWIVFGSCDGTVYASAAPTNFSNLLTAYSGSSEGTTCSAARREYNTGSSYDPSTFTSSTANWISYTIAINPSPPTGFGVSGFAYNY